jgi:group II intron reverse transcriptase/maturase
MAKAVRGFSDPVAQIPSRRGGTGTYAGLERIAEKAKAAPHERFTALSHHVTGEYLKETFSLMNRHGAPGVDHVSMAEYGLNLDANLTNLVDRMKRRAYDAPPVRRVYIPKAGNPDKLRPLGIPAVEDRLLQAAVARLLSAIYEPIFRDSSFGFRPGRSAHDALRRVREAVMGGRVQYVFETDVRSFFDRLDHDWLMRMLELKVGDPWILRLVRKWLKAGIFENGTVAHPANGSPQGGPLSPVLANVYLHYVLDLWFDKVVRSGLRGTAELVRYADDLLVLFENETDAQRFAQTLPERLAKFGLEVAPEKTRLIPFGAGFWRQGKGATGTFDFLGFSHHLGTSRKGKMNVVRTPAKKGVHRFVMGIKAWLKANMHRPPREQQQVLSAKLRGYYQYYGLPTCHRPLAVIQYRVSWYWGRSLRRRSQRGRPWAELNRRPWFTLPAPKIVHPTV